MTLFITFFIFWVLGPSRFRCFVFAWCLPRLVLCPSWFLRPVRFPAFYELLPFILKGGLICSFIHFRSLDSQINRLVFRLFLKRPLTTDFGELVHLPMFELRKSEGNLLSARWFVALYFATLIGRDLEFHLTYLSYIVSVILLFQIVLCTLHYLPL